MLEIILKLLHPITPFVTEEIWHVLPGERTTIMTEPFPEKNSAWHNQQAESRANLFMGIVTGIRNIRSEMMIHPSAEIEVIVVCHDTKRAEQITGLSDSIKGLTRTVSFEVKEEGERPKGAATYIYTDIEIFVPMAGLVDIEKETAKLAKEQAKIETQLKKTQGKLKNEKFLANAPDDVVAKEKEKLEMFTAKLTKIQESIKRLEELA